MPGSRNMLEGDCVACKDIFAPILEKFGLFLANFQHFWTESHKEVARVARKARIICRSAFEAPLMGQRIQVSKKIKWISKFLSVPHQKRQFLLLFEPCKFRGSTGNNMTEKCEWQIPEIVKIKTNYYAIAIKFMRLQRRLSCQDEIPEWWWWE